MAKVVLILALSFGAGIQCLHFGVRKSKADKAAGAVKNLGLATVLQFRRSLFSLNLRVVTCSPVQHQLDLVTSKAPSYWLMAETMSLFFYSWGT